MKRPSECADKGNGWLHTYKGDKFPNIRKRSYNLYKRECISKEIAEANIIIAEHDQHMSIFSERWNDPELIGTKGTCYTADIFFLLLNKNFLLFYR